MATAPENPSIGPLDVIRLLRSAGAALFTQASLHGQLARVEWAEAKTRLLGVAWGLVAAYGLIVAFAWHRLRTLSARSSQAFAATREELAADLALLKERL